MSATVRLKDIVEALEMPIDEDRSFLDLDTGEVYTVSRTLLGEAEECADDEEPDLPDWQWEEWEICRKIAFTGRCVKLPTKYDVHEWEIMREFADAVESARIREDLQFAIHGAGAFRNFKHILERHRIAPAWFQFRDQALREIAIEWCEGKQIAWK